MIKFIIKGLLRDRSRSLFPVLVVLSGVMLTVLMHCWIRGTESDMIRANASFSTGHVKIMSRAYAKEADQIPNDLAYIGVSKLIDQLNTEWPNMIWTPRIRFGGLLDIPDSNGETRVQGPVMGMAVDLLAPQSHEISILNLKSSVVRGRLPEKPGELLISDEFAQRLDVNIGETATLISATMYGSMATANFTIVGTLNFGVAAMDRGAVIADVQDIQRALDMQDAAGEILGFSSDMIYRPQQIAVIEQKFNQQYSDKTGEFAPVMLALSEQYGLSQTLEMISSATSFVIVIFVSVMSIVLWNAGLMGSLRRYGEFGIRLAMGESKAHLYRSLILESFVIGCMGSVLGTAVGLLFAYYLQVHGFDISSMMKNASMMMSNVMRARITPASFAIGFVPGILATTLGTSISGLGIYRRQTSQLTKEFEA
ncbi:FtsX-like permease family protein [candidate division KSB1 bacterium]|nr:FtsX-like permease family protein [candidate division KSB1 bacterium]